MYHIQCNDPEYPPALRQYLGKDAPHQITAIGNPDILRQKTTTLFCSGKCPGKIILQAYNLAKDLRKAGITVISGFHSSIEQDCLDILLRGVQPLIISPARNIINMRIQKKYKPALNSGRLLFLSPFSENQARATIKLSHYRNRFVAALADRIIIIHAEPASKTETLCKEILSWQKPVDIWKIDPKGFKNS